MKFTRMRMLGFKSFVEPTEVLIEPGMTGVVGPNGCGKSNLVEALRWVMGESSYKNMRASGMDDVIFSGSGNRPARNTAEVTLVVDNSQRLAPAAFNDTDTLEITRRIEREAGSAYKINGRDVRARDVQLLFADASTGSRSPALVRQGQIGELINAKPEQRRRLLEEAAGISGLYSRRHEAELRLRAAESNMERLNDVIGQVEGQLQGLKRQARHATRYKSLSAEIRKAQALVLHLKWTGINAAVAESENGLAVQTKLVSERTERTAVTAKERAIAAHALPGLREKEAEAAAALQRLLLARDSLDMELQRANQRMSELSNRLKQLEQDLAREQAMIAETGETQAKLSEEENELLREADGAGDAETVARTTLQTANKVLGESEQSLSTQLDEVARLRAQRSALERSQHDLNQRVSRLEHQLRDAENQLAQAEQARLQHGDIESLSAQVVAASTAVETHEREHHAAVQAVASARDAEAKLREPVNAAERDAHSLRTEINTLSRVLNVGGDGQWPPVVDSLNVEKGFEAALGAALGDDLEAPASADAPAHWDLVAARGTDPALPDGVTPLAGKVKAPVVLARRLAQIGIVTREQGKALQAQLQPGQRLVTVEGDLWRWDGYTAAAEAPTAAAQRPAQRNRLGELEAQVCEADARIVAARAQLDAAIAAVKTAVAAEEQGRKAWRDAQTALSQARDQLAAAERRANQETARISALQEGRARIKTSLEEAREQLQAAIAALAALGDTGAREQALNELRTRVAQERAVVAEAQARFDGLKREAELRQRRLDTIKRERESWAKRRENAHTHSEELQKRLSETAAELETLEGRPAEIELSRRRLMSEVAAAEEARNTAANAVAHGDGKLNEADQASRVAEQQLSQAREERARIESRLEAAKARREEISQEIADQAGVPPGELLPLAGFTADQPLPKPEETEARLEQLSKERERIGAVNLRAEEELVEVDTQLTSMVTEREDLDKAIRRLRQGIGQLNKEGRERLLAAFETVNGHFQQLFTTLFNGGSAELQLTESEDPLEAGLEILARPPGKKPQTLSLLSGGEQALTALSLIFAVFLTNPAPICVLDEVDAPLDDANVERFCTLIEEMTRATETRFMIITHHPLTMSRMDRLFGVTMAERGVSQLVSVDLETAARFREAS